MPVRVSTRKWRKNGGLWSTKVATALTAALCSLALLGCSEMKLVSFKARPENDWSIHAEPKAPANAVEEAVVLAAQTRRDIPVESSDCVYVFEDRAAQFVDVVERADDSDPFVLRCVTRYRVVDNKIAARTATSMEVFPNVDFERTALKVAAMAGGTDSVILYDSDASPAVLSSRKLGKCAAEVRIFNKDESARPFAKKVINFCFK